MKPRWRSLATDGALNGRIKAEAEHASGAYAVREKDGHRVVYVGESNRGRMWRTLLRHFQAPESFRRVRESGVFTRSPERYEVALWVTSKGRRSRASGKAPDERAMQAQAEWIAALKPSQNVDDGQAFVLEYEADDDPWGGLLNPAGAWTELGRLTRLTYDDGRRERVIRWPLRRAPALVYDASRKGPNAAIVYDERPVRAATAAEVREYARTHWGQDGRGEVSAGGVALPPWRVLGPGLSVTYTTRKGSAELVDWVHPWGEGGPRRFVPPTVLLHECAAPKCAARGRVSLRGGSYHVSERGIVG